MIQNLYIDLCTYLDGGGIGTGNKREPITYLTQWKLVGNSEVIGEQILSCGDLGEDGKYHILIKADSKVIDIPLDEPLRKVGDVADTIEFPSDTPNTARVTRNIGSVDLGSLEWSYNNNLNLFSTIYPYVKNYKTGKGGIGLNTIYKIASEASYPSWSQFPDNTIAVGSYYFSTQQEDSSIVIKDTSCKTAKDLTSNLSQCYLLYELATSTTSYISVPNIPLTKAYSSANQVSYSEFAYENPNALYIDGEPMLDEDGNEIVMKVGRKTFNID